MKMPFKQTLLAMGLAGLVAGCATPLAADGRLDTARGDIESAASSGAVDQATLNRARSALQRGEAAREAGDEALYDATVDLTGAYTDLAMAEGRLGQVDGRISSLESSLSSAESQANSCSANLSRVRGELRACQAAGGGAIAELAEAMGAFRTERTDRGTRFILREVGFGLESASLTTEAEERLGALSDFLRDHSGMTVSIAGHTDTTGPTDYNQALSTRRAEAVSEMLGDAGINASRVSTTGYGESQPVASNDTRAGRIANRRVEITLMGAMSDS